METELGSLFYHFKPYLTQTGTKYVIVRIVNVRVDKDIFDTALRTIKEMSLAKGKEGWWVMDKHIGIIRKTGIELFDKLPKKEQTEIRDYLEMNEIQ